MSCDNKTKQRCGTIVYDACVKYQGTTNENSPLVDNDCLSIQETTQDIYDQLEKLNLSELGESCLEYVQEGGKIYVKHVLKKFEEEICNLKEQVESLQTVDICNKLITECNLDFGGLVDECGNQPQTLGETLQLILNKLNE